VKKLFCKLFIGGAALWLFLSFCACQAADISTANTPLFAGKRVLWLGDSITQDGKYVTFTEYYLNRLFPSQKFDIISIGLASETVSGLTEKQHPFPRPDLFNRLQNALALTKPQIVVACYGMNDGIYHPQSPERMQAFENGVNKLIAAAKAANAKLILLTPPPFDPLPVKSVRPADAPDFAYFAPFANYDDVLSDYAKWEMTLTSDDVLVVDLHTPLNDFLKQQRETNPTFSYSSDGIHPNAVGHLLMARTILNALGVPMDANNLDAELNKIQADPLFPLVAKHRQTRSDGWLAYVGYTRDKTVKSDSIESTEKTAADLQQQIDQLRQPIRVACVGDSIVYGAFLKNRERNNWPTVLGRWLGDGWRVHNFGLNGATMLMKGDLPYQKQPIFNQALKLNPDIVIISLGGNDSKHPNDQFKDAANNWQYKDDYVGDYKKMIAAFKADNPAIKIYVCTPLPAFPGRWGINDTTIREEIVPKVRQVAQDTGATVIDFNTALGSKPEMFLDTVHPNVAGARLVAATVFRTLTDKEPPTDTP
jgi:lysophospholipase L1-like esterase